MLHRGGARRERNGSGHAHPPQHTKSCSLTTHKCNQQRSCCPAATLSAATAPNNLVHAHRQHCNPLPDQQPALTG